MNGYKKLLILILVSLLSFIGIQWTSREDTDAIKSCKAAYNKVVLTGTAKQGNYVCVDFSKPSTEKRMYVLNVNGNVIYKTWVAHGINSGKGKYATQFSNRPGSYQSSLGVYQLGPHHQFKGVPGPKGFSWSMIGIDGKWNSNAYMRAILIHAATYIGDGKTGHSLGCFAVTFEARDMLKKMIDTGSVLIAYHPQWAGNSKWN